MGRWEGGIEPAGVFLIAGKETVENVVLRWCRVKDLTGLDDEEVWRAL